MGQSRTVYDISDGIHAFDIGTVVVVYFNFTSFHFDTQFFQPDVFNIGSDTDSRQYHFSFVGLDLIFLIPDIDFQ